MLTVRRSGQRQRSSPSSRACRRRHDIQRGIHVRVALASAIIEVTSVPHLGCKKFAARFGVEAMKFANSRRGKKLCLRGINAKVVKPGQVIAGDRIRKLS